MGVGPHAINEIMNILEEDGLPRIAQHLFNLGETLSLQTRHRYSALAFAAASRTAGTTPRLQALALYKSATELHFAIQVGSDELTKTEDTSRAISYLQKCTLLLREHRAGVDMHLQAFALLERVYTQSGNHVAAAKTINTALSTVPKAAGTPAVQLQWWCYFRTRAIANLLQSGSAVLQACHSAEESARQCEILQDPQGAAGFYLIQCQLSIGATVNGLRNVPISLHKANANIERFVRPPNQQMYMDQLIMRFAYCFLQSLALIRNGNVGEVKDNIVSELSKWYNRLRSARKEGRRATWKWIPQNYLSALTFYITTAVSRANGNRSKALVHAMTALSRLGITENNVTSFTLGEVCREGETERASLSLVIALLESAARIRLAEVNLDDASILIGAAVDLTFQDEASRRMIRSAEAGRALDIDLSEVLIKNVETVGLIPRCTALMLLAEYHNLRGKVSSARVATDLLQAVRYTAFQDIPNANSCKTDTWHMAISYLTLLTGDRRSDIAAMPSSSSSGDDFATITSPQTKAFAYFTVGVYHMRHTDVLESRIALKDCLNLLQEESHGNEQIIANAMTVLSGLVLTRESISQDATNMTQNAVNIARSLNDQVTLVRAARQQKKLADRLSYSPEERQQADAAASQALQSFLDMQQSAGLVFSS